MKLEQLQYLVLTLDRTTGTSGIVDVQFEVCYNSQSQRWMPAPAVSSTHIQLHSSHVFTPGGRALALSVPRSSSALSLIQTFLCYIADWFMLRY